MVPSIRIYFYKSALLQNLSIGEEDLKVNGYVKRVACPGRCYIGEDGNPLP
jgi:hypothetical protein